jgi:hypothetical protein
MSVEPEFNTTHQNLYVVNWEQVELIMEIREEGLDGSKF